MSEINYTYQITSVDESARCMEIVFSSEGRQTMFVGARLPFEGEAIEDVVKMYAPISYWLDLEKSVAAPQVGHSGEITVSVATPDVAEQVITIPVDAVGGA